MDYREGGKEAKAVATIHDSWSVPGIFGAGVKTTDEYTEGSTFLVVPVYSSIGRDGQLGGSVIFVEPYSSWGEQGEVAASLGLGWRHLFSSQSVEAITRHDGHQAGFFEEGVFIGANIFVDMLDTQFDNQFWQLGVGIEAGTRYFDVRANYYIPLSDRELALERRTSQTFTNSSTSTSQRTTPINDPYATGNTIAQDANVATLATTTTTTTTIEQLFRLYEEGMEGWDAEASVLVPGLDRYFELRLIGGYYSFDNQPFGPQTGGTGNVEGWKAGVEVRPVPAVALTATWYEDERFVGDNWLYGMRLEIPFESGDLGDGKTFWRRIGDAFSPRRRHLAERMVEPVRRQNEAIKIGNESETETSTSTSTRRVTRVVSQSAQHLVLVDDVIFVNNNGPTGNGIQTGSDATGTGTAELPFATIQLGSTTAQANSNTTARVWNVYTQGTQAGYTGNVVATNGSVNFIGSGRLIAGLNGTTFGTGPAPALSGGFRASGIPYFGVTAYNITGGLSSGDADGIRLLNVASFLIDGNTISQISSDAIDVRSNGTNVSTGTIVRNTLLGAGDAGIEVDAREGSTLNLLALSNVFDSISGDAVKASARESGTLNLSAIGNSFSGGSSDAFDVLGVEGGTVNFIAAGNTITNGADDGFYFEANEGSTINATITDNLISFVQDDGIDFDAYDGSVISLRAERNTIGFTGDYGVAVEMYDDATGTADINDNTISFTGVDGVQFFLSGADVALTANVNRNTITLTGSDGIDGNTYLGAELNINAANNTLTNIGDDGFDFQTSTLGQITAVLANNTVTNPSGNGMLLRTTLGAQLDVTVLGGAFINAADSSIDASSDFGTTAQLDLVVTGVTFTNAAFDHIYTYSGSSTTINLTVTGSTFTTNALNDGSMVFAEVDDNSNQNITITGNSMVNTNAGANASSGIIILGYTTSDIDLNISGNLIQNVAFNPMYVEANDSSDVTGSITNNVVNGMVGGAGPTSGIELSARNGGDFNLTQLSGNTVIGATGSGIAGVIVNSGTINILAMSGNTVRDIVPGAGSRHGIVLEATTAGNLTVTGFDGNTILNVQDDGINLNESGTAAISIDGTINIGNNIINGVGGIRVNDVNNNVGGTFHLGAPVNLNRAANNDVTP